MKNSKIVFAFLPAILIALFVYFSTTGFSNEPGENASKATFNSFKKTSTVTLHVTITDLGLNHCLNGTYTYCLNSGVGVFIVGETFDIEVPCDEPISICVASGSCTGTWTGSVSCDTRPSISIDISPYSSKCPCH